MPRIPPVVTDKQAREVNRFLRRLEKLGRRLLRVEFKNASDFWQFQQELIALQRDIQAAIGAEKRLPKRERSQSRVEHLRYTRYRARQLGDAFAWLLLRLNSKYIRALSENARTPVAQEDHGSIGVSVIGEHLARKGWGFPLIHDATECLRIGDVTFIRSPESDPPFVSVEVKTALIGTDQDESGNPTVKYEIRLLSPLQLNPDTGEVVSTPQSRGVDPTAMPAPIRRNDRQAERMLDAVLRQSVPEGEVLELSSGPLISIANRRPDEGHWKELRRLIRLARSSGYAGCLIDDAFFYSVFYQKGGISEELIQHPGFTDDMLSSGFLHRENGGPNSMVLIEVPPSGRRDSRAYLPFYLFSLPKRAIFELLRRELLVMVSVNPGKVEDYLRDRGFDVRSADGNLAYDSLTVMNTFTVDSGQSFGVELHGLEHYVNETVYEFRSIDFIAQAANDMLAVAEEQAVGGMAQRTFDSPGVDEK